MEIPAGNGSTPSPAPSAGTIGKLSPDVISRHMPPSSAGEVLPGLWVGNLMSVSHLDDIVQRSIGNTVGTNTKVTVTVISVLSNPKLIRLATDALEQQRLEYASNHSNNISTTNAGSNLTMDMKHVIIRLKDLVDSDLLEVLPSALSAIDEALGSDAYQESSTLSDPTNSTDGDDQYTTNNNAEIERVNRICLVHCAKGASRSVSVVIAYLLSRQPNRFKTFEETLNYVRTVRPQAQPNIGFALALRRYERGIHVKLHGF